jgi:hypothetical protein
MSQPGPFACKDLPGHLGSARSGEDVARRPAAILGHIFGGHDERADQAAQDPATPAQRTPTHRPSATRRVAVSNAAREAIGFVACCCLVGVVGVLLYDILRAVRRR